MLNANIERAAANRPDDRFPSGLTRSGAWTESLFIRLFTQTEQHRLEENWRRLVELMSSGLQEIYGSDVSVRLLDVTYTSQDSEPHDQNTREFTGIS